MRETAPLGLLRRIRLLWRRDLTLANFLDRTAQAAGAEAAPLRLTEPLAHRRLGGRLAVTYGQMVDFARRLGHVLEEAGLSRHDRVVIYKSNAPDYFLLSLAVIRAGGIAVPVHGQMSLDGLGFYLELTGARFVITDRPIFEQRIGDPDALPMVEKWLFPQAPEGFGGRSVDLDSALEEAPAERPPARVAASDPVLIVHTSGTTGFPKGVTHTSASSLGSLRRFALTMPVFRSDRQLFAWPTNHVVAHHTGFATLASNVPGWFPQRFDAGEVLDLIDREHITQYFGFPDTYLELLEHGLDRHRLESMRFWFATADASHEAHVRAFTERGAALRLFGRPVVRSVFVEGLGTSEVNGPALLRFTFSGSRRFDRFVGRRAPLGPKVKVADENGRPLKAGKVGRLMVKGKSLFQGYWNADHLMLETFRDGWWWTGDLVYRDRWGRYYHLDRAIDVIETANGPVYTLPIEEVLLKHPAVSEAVVFGVETGDGDAVPVALISPRSGQRPEPEAIRAWANERLSATGALSAVRPVETGEIQRGLTGKVLKRVLRERFASGWGRLSATSPG